MVENTFKRWQTSLSYVCCGTYLPHPDTICSLFHNTWLVRLLFFLFCVPSFLLSMEFCIYDNDHRIFLSMCKYVVVWLSKWSLFKLIKSTPNVSLCTWWFRRYLIYDTFLYFCNITIKTRCPLQSIIITFHSLYLCFWFRDIGTLTYDDKMIVSDYKPVYRADKESWYKCLIPSWKCSPCCSA